MKFADIGRTILFCLGLLASIAARSPVHASDDVQPYVVLVDSGAVLRDRPGDSSLVVHRFGAADFANAYPVVDVFMAPDGHRFFKIEASDEDGEVVTGWIDGAPATVLDNMATGDPPFLRRTISAERLRVLSYRGRVRSTQSIAHRKVVVVDDTKMSNADAATPGFHDNSRLEGQPRGYASTFKIRHVFREIESSAFARAYLVGTRRFLSPSTAAQTLEGWISGRRLVEWNSRLGFEFKKSNFAERRNNGGLALVFRTEQGLVQFLEDGRLNDLLIGEENSPEPMVYLQDRFPVIKKLGKRGEHVLYEVALIGRSPQIEENRNDVPDTGSNLVGYVSDRNVAGLQQLDFRVLVEKDLIESLKFSVKRLEQSLRHEPDSSSRSELEDLLVRTLQAMTGDEPDRFESIGTFLEKRTALPVRTELLNVTVGQFVHLASNRNTDFRQKAIRDFARIGALLEGVLREREVEFRGWDPQSWKLRYAFAKDNSGREKARLWFFDPETPSNKRLHDHAAGSGLGQFSEQSHAWLPLTMLP